VLVNGLPAAGKSTLAPKLAIALGLPLLSKDLIKETHADVLGAEPPAGLTQREWNRRLGTAASETMWALLGQSAPGAVLESSWRADVRELVKGGLRRAGFAGVAEVWCEAPLPLLRERFARRWASSHAIHGVAPDDEEWVQMVEHAEPLKLGPVLRLDTSGPVDLSSVVEWCRSHAWESSRSRTTLRPHHRRRRTRSPQVERRGRACICLRRPPAQVPATRGLGATHG
jgi:glucokinase